MKTIACIQHLQEEGPGALADWALHHEVAIEVFRADLGQLPSHDGYAAYVLLGGPFDAVGAACPSWLEREKAWLGDVLRQSRPVLGICLGGQLLADRLGARVAPIDRPEGGWCAVEIIGESGPDLEVLQWHERGFALPDGARHLARGVDWANQGYAVGEATIGLQFHPEWTPQIVTALNRRFGVESPLPTPSAADEARYKRMHDWFCKLLDRWAGAW
ncbi:GMP synthase-like glutamine amidotransferase [Pseudomonas sp. SJZ079]|uniref:type 1 glutamine amidotransferase n=1 Tax=Pseudomonas sp. SJZ079 TaxID=2572887 RepID=UPI001199F7F2|nr:type 1 glutamine amidotransferase [Pseudomonas sp. SJZ079]TWC28031.1 GMP synthase-like glutamine amidotransferase [Pseudomonas sp. SJZ079]